MEDYQKYKWFFTSTNTLVVGGKSAAQNDLLIQDLKKEGVDYVMMHTAAPGSPFSCILKDPSKVASADKQECATFTACFSKAWKGKAKKVIVHVFNLSQLNKQKSMNQGTWGVKGDIEEITVEDLRLAIVEQKEVLRAVPVATLKGKKAKLIAKPGTIDKQDLLAKLEIEYGEPLAKDEVLAALPAGGISIEKVKA
jgi:hypothetical protein